jgi:hypothetical protein
MSKLKVKSREAKISVCIRVKKERLELFRTCLKDNNHKMTDVFESAMDIYIKQFKKVKSE